MPPLLASIPIRLSTCHFVYLSAGRPACHLCSRPCKKSLLRLLCICLVCPSDRPTVRPRIHPTCGAPMKSSSHSPPRPTSNSAPVWCSASIRAQFLPSWLIASPGRILWATQSHTMTQAPAALRLRLALDKPLNPKPFVCASHSTAPQQGCWSPLAHRTARLSVCLEPHSPTTRLFGNPVANRNQAQKIIRQLQRGSERRSPTAKGLGNAVANPAS
jgi:hypothetical protein